MTHDTGINRVREAAALWAERLMDGDLSAADRETFQQWLLADELHQVEFRAHTKILNLARDLPEEAREELLALAMESAHQRDRRRTVWFAGLAASVLMTVGLAGWFAYRYEVPSVAHVTLA